MNESQIISNATAIQEKQVAATIQLLEQGGTVPFIARYRKEQTGELDEVEIGKIKVELQKLKELEKRKKTVLATIAEQGKLTEHLKTQIGECFDIQELEDIYLPYKPRRKTRADKAIELGLEPLAKILISQDGYDFYREAEKYIHKELPEVKDVIAGAQDIVALWISERKNIRQKIRSLFWQMGIVKSKVVKGKEVQGEKYKDYFDFEEPAKKIKSHRLLAILRAQKEEILKMTIEPNKKEAIEIISRVILKPNGGFSEEMDGAINEAYTRLIKTSIGTETRNQLKQQADEEAIQVFSENLRQLLLQSPLGGKRVLAIDPGFKSGCKIVCLNENGDLLHNETIYPHPPQNQTALAKKKMATLTSQYKIDAIAIGNGTAGRETESFIKHTKFSTDLKVFIVNEAGASIYSASKVAREEFPDYDITVRGAVSIGRRLMDPLAELVKIDPKSIGVGQYQYDVDQTMLKEQLDAVVESCVNKVGVNLNTASKYLMTYVSGIGPQIAENIVNYRKEQGEFKNRAELKKVAKLGPKAFEQGAGFMRIADGENPLDNSAVHPERYKTVEKICKSVKCTLKDIVGNEEILNTINWAEYVSEEVGRLTLADIQQELLKPGRDPRRSAKVFEFDQNIRKIGDLIVGMELPGIVNNVTNFGAFVDLGIKENGLIHISNLSDEYVSNPADVVSLHQHVTVKVLEIDLNRKRIGLSMKS